MRISDWSSDVCSSDLLDTAETVFAADLDAGLETRMRALHPADHVFDVAKPAERGGLQFRRAGPLGKDQRRLVLALAAGDVAAREQHIAAQVVRARAFDPESKLAGFRFRRVQVGPRSVQIVDQALDRRKSEPGSATGLRGRRHLEQIGRASCRERVCQYGQLTVVAVALK